MINISSEANLREKDEREAQTHRPVNVHMVSTLTILGVKLCLIRRDMKIKTPRTAEEVMDAWGQASTLSPLTRRASVTIWAD